MTLFSKASCSQRLVHKRWFFDWNAWNGFPQFTVYYLEKLYDLVVTLRARRKPKTLRGLLKALIKAVLGEKVDDAEIDRIISKRNLKPASGSDLFEAATLKDVAHLCDANFEEAVNQAAHKHCQSTTKSTGASSSGVRLPDILKGVVDVTHDMDEATATTYLPKVEGCTITKDVTWHFRWKCSYLKKEKNPSRATRGGQRREMSQSYVRVAVMHSCSA